MFPLSRARTSRSTTKHQCSHCQLILTTDRMKSSQDPSKLRAKRACRRQEAKNQHLQPSVEPAQPEKIENELGSRRAHTIEPVLPQTSLEVEPGPIGTAATQVSVRVGIPAGPFALSFLALVRFSCLLQRKWAALASHCDVVCLDRTWPLKARHATRPSTGPFLHSRRCLQQLNLPSPSLPIVPDGG